MRRKKMPKPDDINAELIEELSGLDPNLSLIPANYEDIPTMPIELVRRNKDALAEQKKRAALMLDGKKLEESIKIMGGMQAITDIITDAEVLERVKDNVKTAMDVKFLADAYGKLADKMQTLQRLDSVDSDGNAGMIMLSLQTKNGTDLKVAIKE